MNAPAASPELDRLFGALAIQNGFASAEEVGAALAKVPAGQSLGELLQASELISAEEREILEEQVRRSVDLQGDLRRALDSLGGEAALLAAPVSTAAPAGSAFESFGGDAASSPAVTPAGNSRFEGFGGDASNSPAVKQAGTSRFEGFGGDASNSPAVTQAATSRFGGEASTSPGATQTGASAFESFGGDGPIAPAPPASRSNSRSPDLTQSVTPRPGGAFESFGGDSERAPTLTGSKTPGESGDAEAATLAGSHAGWVTPPARARTASESGLPAVSLEAAGRYEVRREQGRGGQSRVQVAFDRDIAREIAIKELLPQRRTNANAIARFIREARITGQLEHPNIVPVYELGRREDGTYYCAQKLVRGRTYSEALRNRRSLAERLRLLAHFEGLCQAIAYAHSRGVVHRDIKPDNVMVGDFGETVVLDWGLAKARGQTDPDAEPSDASLPKVGDSGLAETQVGSVIGTPAYMSPEQALGDPTQIDERSDVWALGAMLFETLTGRTPFEGDSAVEMIGNVIRAPIPSIRALAPDAPPDLAAIAEKALQRERARRYANATEFAAEIEAFRLGRRVDAYDYSSFELLKRFVAKNRVLTAIVLASVALIGAAATVAFRRDLESRRNLASAFVEKAREAERALSWGEAAVFRAAARTYNPAADLRDSVAFEGAFEARPQARLQGHEAPIDFMAASPTTPLLITGSRDGTVGFWDLARPGLIARQPAHPGSSDIVVALSPTGRTAASLGNGAKGTLTLWDPQTRSPRWTVSAPNRQMALAVSPDEETLAAATEDHLELWSIGRRAVVRSWPVSDPPTALGFFDGGRQLLSGHASGALHVWDTATGKEVRSLAGHQGWVSYLRLSRDGKFATTTSYDHHVAVWDLTTGKAVATFPGHEGPALESAFSPDGNLVASVGFDGAMRVWDIPTQTRLARILVPGVSLITVSFTPDGKSLIAAGSDQLIRMWSVPSPYRTDPIDPGAQGLVESADGRLLAFVAPDKSIGVWDLEQRALVRRLVRAKPANVDALSFAGDGGRLAVRGAADLTIWNVTQGRAVTAFTEHPQQMLASALSGDGRELALGLATGAVEVWDVDAHHLAATFERKGGTPAALSFSREGGVLAALYSDGALQLFDLATRKPLSTSVPGTGLEFFTFFDDGRALWQTADHRLHLGAPGESSGALVLEGPHAPLGSAALSPEGTTLIAAAQDATVRLWDAKDGTALASLDHHWAAPASVAYGPEREAFTVAGADGHLRRFHLVQLPAPKPYLAKVEREFGLKLVGIELEEASP